MTNEYGGGKLSIMKCDQCRDGYLVVKPGKSNGYFLGCTNYKSDGTGCSKSISKLQYYEMMQLAPDVEPVLEDSKPTVSTIEKVNVSPQARKVSSAQVAPIVRKADTNAVCFEEADLNDIVHTNFAMFSAC